MTGIETCRCVLRRADIIDHYDDGANTEKDKVQALDVGADDYVTKPFSMQEMQARIRAALRRTVFCSESRATRLRLGDIEIDFRARRVMAPNKQERLTCKVFDLFSYLASHPNRALAHRDLLHAGWGSDYGNEREYLRVFINRLRKKIEPSPKSPKYLLKEPC
jgi:two-component system KDP operon response regulator KdpE